MAHIPGPPWQPGQVAVAKLPTGLAVAAMVCGIVSIPIMCIPYLGILSLPCSITGIVLGCIANGKAKRGEGGGKGMAVTGIVCGSVSLGIFILLLILVLVVGASFLGFMKTIADEAQKQQQLKQGGGSSSGDEGSMVEPMLQSIQMCHVYATYYIAFVI